MTADYPALGGTVRLPSTGVVLVTTEICLAESHAAPVKHAVITGEKTMGMMKRYFRLTTVIAAKQMANPHVVPGMSARVVVERFPSCHANSAENRRNTPTHNATMLAPSLGCNVCHTPGE
jgi:hypothetical protein